MENLLMFDMETQMSAHKEHVSALRSILAEVLVSQSSPRLSSKEQKDCKKYIKALQAAIEALDSQIYA